MFRNYSLADTAYIPQYQGMPLQEMDELGGVLQQRYDTALDYYDRLNAAAADVQVLEQDNIIKQEQLDDIKNTIDLAAERGGAWEEMVPVLRQKSNAFRSNEELKQAQKNREYRIKWQNELQKRRDEGKITDTQYRYAIQQSPFKGTRITKEDDDYIEGGPMTRTFSGYAPANYFDLNKFSDEFIRNYKSDKYPLGIKPKIDPATGLVEYYSHGDQEVVRAEDVQQDLLGALVSNGQAMDYLNEYSKITGLGINELALQAISPYANKAAFSKTDMDYMKGSAADYRGRAKTEEEKMKGSLYNQTTTSPYKVETIDIASWDNKGYFENQGKYSKMLAGSFTKEDLERERAEGSGVGSVEKFIAYNKSSNPQVAEALEDIVSSNPKSPDMSDRDYADYVSEIFNQRATFLSNFEGLSKNLALDDRKEATDQWIGYIDKGGKAKLGVGVPGGVFYYQDQGGNPKKGKTFDEVLKELDMTQEQFIGTASVVGEYKVNPFTGGDGLVFTVNNGERTMQMVLGTSTVEQNQQFQQLKRVVEPQFSPSKWESPEVEIVDESTGTVLPVRSKAIERWLVPNPGGQPTVLIAKKGTPIPKGATLQGRDVIVEVKDEGIWKSHITLPDDTEIPITTENLYNIIKSNK